MIFFLVETYVYELGWVSLMLLSTNEYGGADTVLHPLEIMSIPTSPKDTRDTTFLKKPL